MREPFDSVVVGGTSRSPVAAWRAQANCLNVNPELFFPERDASGRNGGATRRTINEYCVPCPVRKECLEAGLCERYGVWGGTTPKERRALRKERLNEPPREGLRILLIRS